MSIMQTLSLQPSNAVNQSKKVFTSAQLLRIQNLRKRIVIRKGFMA
jgi:hypothetical protein